MTEQTDKATYQARVISADAGRGTFIVALEKGGRLSLSAPPGHAAWQRLRPGLELELMRSTLADGQVRYSVRLPAPSASGEPPSQAPAQQTPEPGASPVAEPEPPRQPPYDVPMQRSGADGEPERPITCPDVRPIFEMSGPVNQLLGERYRPRPGQILMAEQVRQALQEKRHAVIEAGTGIGKSFAYLIPLIWSGTRAVVSTSNKALMSQLWHKDLPALRRVAPRPFDIALLKGRGNYLCALRLRELPRGRQLTGVTTDTTLIEAGLRRVPSGDVEEMGLPIRLRQRFTIDHHACEGRKCPEFRTCFYEQAKAAAEKADIVVTNHALLSLSVLRQDNTILPVRPVLVIDEAHELEGYAVGALSVEIDRGTLGAIVNHPIARDAVDGALRQQVMELNEAFFRAVRRQQPSRPSTRWALQGEIQEGLALWAALERFHRELKSWSAPKDLEGQYEVLVRSCEDALFAIQSLAKPEPEHGIRLCEFADDASPTDLTTLRIQYRPLEVSDALKTGLFDVWPRVITTSATLSVNDDMGWFQRRAGAISAGSPTIVQQIHSPFDYPEQVLVYAPRDPRLRPQYSGEAAEAYADRLTGEVKRLIEASKGRAFVLCTSRARMQQLHERLKPVLPYLSLCQAPGVSRQELVERFQADGHAVLFGTRSFWEGVDIPGEALSLVILDKIPFLPIDDPVLERQKQRIIARGGNWFVELQLGQAILTLRQGAGRLVRAESDRGVIALLDSRIHEKDYGAKILRSLPNGRPTARFEDVQAFFASGRGSGALA